MYYEGKMKHCRTCGREIITSGPNCGSCVDSWLNMRTEIFNELKRVYGPLTGDNLELFKKITSKLSKLWKKDKELYKIELSKISDGVK